MPIVFKQSRTPLNIILANVLLCCACAQADNSVLSALLKSLYNTSSTFNTADNVQKNQILKSVTPIPKTKLEADQAKTNTSVAASLLQSELSGIAPALKTAGQLNPYVIAQCVVEATPSTFISGGNFEDAFKACYSSVDPSKASMALSTVSGVTGTSAFKQYKNIAFLQLKANYCGNDASKGLQARLLPCPSNAAVHVYQDIRSWWRSNKDHLGLSVTDKNNFNAVICQPKSGSKACAEISKKNAKSNLGQTNMQSTLDTLVKYARGQLVKSMLPKFNQQGINTATGLDQLLDSDRLSSQSNDQACWANTEAFKSSGLDNGPFQRVNVNVAPPILAENFLSAIAGRFPGPARLYPTLNIPTGKGTAESYMLAVSSKNANTIDLVSLKQLHSLATTSNARYWDNSKKSTKATKDALDFRKNQIEALRATQSQYSSAAQKSAVLRDAGLANITALMHLRTPNPAFSTEQSSSCPGKVASTQEWMKTTAMMRQNKQWLDAIKKAQLGETMRQATILLSEIRTQLYLNNLLMQRMLASTAITQLESSSTTDGALSKLESNLSGTVESIRKGGNQKPNTSGKKPTQAESLSSKAGNAVNNLPKNIPNS